MKLAPYSAADSRKDRTDRLRRGRAAALALRSAFPMLRQLRLEFEFEGDSTTRPAAQSHVLHPPAAAFFSFTCPHPDCDGQFDLAEAVNAALEDSSNESCGAIECIGLRLRKHPSKEPCLLKLRYNVIASYSNPT